MKKILFLILILCGLTPSVVAQNEEDDSEADSIALAYKHASDLRNDTLDADAQALANMKLPPLSVFLEAAEKHASVRIYDEKRLEAMYQFKRTRMNWLNDFHFIANYQYGKNYSISGSASTDNPEYFYQNGNRTQSQYSVGASFSVPLGDILGMHKYEVKANKAKMNQLEYEYQNALESRKLTILNAYSQVAQELATFQSKAESAALYNAQMRISENDFINGRIDVISLSLERGRRTSAIVSYESSRVTLQNAITLLELLTGVNITK